MPQTPAQRQSAKRARDAHKLKSFSEFMTEIDQLRSVQAANVIADMSEQLQMRASETSSLFRECFSLQESSPTVLCEEVIRFTKDRNLQQCWWRFLKALENHHDKNINRIIDKRIKELDK